MSNYKVIGIDLAKRNFSLAAINVENKVVLKKSIKREDFFVFVSKTFPKQSTFAMEACGGSHNMAQSLQDLGHTVILLKTKDVKAYAKSKQKNDINDAIAICKAACDPELKKVSIKTKLQQEISYFHKVRKNLIKQRIQKSNSIMTSLQEFGYIVKVGKKKFTDSCKQHLDKALSRGDITRKIYREMLLDYKDLMKLLEREKAIDFEIIKSNKQSVVAIRLQEIPGIGPINASILGNKNMEEYDSPKDFAASLGIVPSQYTTGGKVSLGSITKQGDRYARTMLIQAGRSIAMRISKKNPPKDPIYQFAIELKNKNKPFNVICVALANKLARIAYACTVNKVSYSGVQQNAAG